LLKRIAIALVLLPAAEVAAFLLVVWAIGFGPALGLMILTSLGGALVLWRLGRGRFASARRAVRRNGVARAATDGDGVMLAVAGILLVLPGFITDLVGAGLLVGPIRRRVAAAIGRASAKVPGTATGPPVIDLAPDEWRSIPDRKRRRPKG